VFDYSAHFKPNKNSIAVSAKEIFTVDIRIHDFLICITCCSLIEERCSRNSSGDKAT
jgi:hypothetical protein